MKSQLRIVLILFGNLLALSLVAQETATPSDISIPGVLNDGSPSEPVAEQAQIPFRVVSSHTKRVYVTEAPEMPGLPAPKGIINVTVQTVLDPSLPVLVGPRTILSSSPESEAPVMTDEEPQEPDGDTYLTLVSATVYNHSRTLLTISPTGKSGDEVSAWSNVDFNHFSAFSTFRVTDVNGTIRDYALLMGIGNEDELLTDSEASENPKLPDLSAAGPSFSVIRGKQKVEAMKLLTQLHDLYRKEGVKLEAAFHAREKAYAERRAYLIANPPVPNDVVVRFWKPEKPKRSLTTPEEPTP